LEEWINKLKKKVIQEVKKNLDCTVTHEYNFERLRKHLGWRKKETIRVCKKQSLNLKKQWQD